MNRRKPQLRVAVVPVEGGEDVETAVLRKACRLALAALSAQGAAGEAEEAVLAPFVAAYLAGFARHAALKHGVDAEQGETPMRALARELSALAPQHLRPAIGALRFHPRATSRTAIRAEGSLADAGWLVGHLESLCGSRNLAGLARRLHAGGDAAGFLTACDHAADRLQTHQPTLALRFDPVERAAVQQAFAASPGRAED